MKFTHFLKSKICRGKFFISILTLGIIILSGSQSVKAQELSKDGKIYGGLGYFSAGFTQINIDALNTRLQKEGFAAVPSQYLTFGGGGHGIIGNVIIGGEGQSLSLESTTVDHVGTPVESSLEGGYGFMNIGYVVYSKKALLLYPLLGLGGGGMRLKLSDAPQATSFQNILQNYQHNIEIDNGGFLLNLQLAADFVLSGDERGRGGLLLGLHAGYIYSPTKWNWTWGGAGIADGPEVNLDGPYLRLTIGGGGFGRLKRK